MDSIPQCSWKDSSIGEIKRPFLYGSGVAIQRWSENIFAQRVADDPLPSRENRPSPNGWSGQVEEIGGRILGVMFKACIS